MSLFQFHASASTCCCSAACCFSVHRCPCDVRALRKASRLVPSNLFFIVIRRANHGANALWAYLLSCLSFYKRPASIQHPANPNAAMHLAPATSRTEDVPCKVKSIPLSTLYAYPPRGKTVQQPPLLTSKSNLRVKDRLGTEQIHPPAGTVQRQVQDLLPDSGIGTAG